jgi:hypothetical protein
MGRSRGTIKSDKAEAKHKLRQRARRIVFAPENDAVPDEEFDYEEFNYYVDVLSKGSRPKPSANHNLSEGYRRWLEGDFRHWLEDEERKEDKAQQEWDQMLADRHWLEGEFRRWLRRKQLVARRKRRPSLHIVRKRS